jgi:hypothetical protein
MKHEPSNYSGPEAVQSVKDALNHVKDALASKGISSELMGDWYHWILQVDLDSSDRYKAIEAREVEGKISYNFESIRLRYDGEILYRGCTIDSDHPELYSELVSEAQRQHDWVKSRQVRQEEIEKNVQLSEATLNRLREEFPLYTRSLCIHSHQNCTFSLTLNGLTEELLRKIIKETPFHVG